MIRLFTNNKVLAVLISALNLIYFFVVHRNIIYNYLPILRGPNSLFIFLIFLKLNFAGFALGLILYKRIKTSSVTINFSNLSSWLSYIILLTVLLNYIEMMNRWPVYIISSIIIFIPSILYGLLYARIIKDLGNEYHKIMFYLLIGSAVGVFIYNYYITYAPFIYVYFSFFLIFQIFSLNKRNVIRKSSIMVVVLFILTMVAGKQNFGQFYKPHRFFPNAQLKFTNFAPDGILDVFYLLDRNEYMMVSDKHSKSTISVKGRIKNVQHKVKIPYKIKDFDKSLIIGVGGGQDIVAALHYGVGDITAVELSNARINLMKGEFAEYSNFLFFDERVKIVNDSGRAFLRKNKEKFDLISIVRPLTIKMTNTFAYDSTQELFTEEAFDVYLNALNDEGILYINVPLRTQKMFIGLKNRFEALKNNILIFLLPQTKVPGVVVIISKEFNLMNFYLKNKDQYQYIYYPNMEIVKGKSDVTDYLAFDENGIQRRTDKQFNGIFNPLQLNLRLSILIMILFTLFLVSKFLFKDVRSLVYFSLGIGYEIVLIFFVIWLSMFTVNMAQLMPIAFTSFFALGSIGYWHSAKVNRQMVSSISIILVLIFIFVLTNNLFLSEHGYSNNFIIMLCVLFIITGYLITFPFGFLLRSEQNFFRALSIDYLGSLIALPIIILLPNLDYLLILSIIIYLCIGLFMIKRAGRLLIGEQGGVLQKDTIKQ